MSTPPSQAGQPLDINALIAQVQTMAGTGPTDYIGLPSGVPNLQQVPGATPNRPAPLYGEGSQWLPVLANAGRNEVVQLQDRLVNTGLLTGDYRQGVWDAPSQKAFMDVLGLANASGTTWQEALKSYEDSAPMVYDSRTNSYVKGAPGQRAKPATVTRFTNPDDIATAAQEVAVSKLGRSFTPEEVQRFVRAYHGMEGAEGSAQGAATPGAGGGAGGYTAAPAVQTAAETFAKQTDPTAYNAEQFLPLVQKMNDLLSGPGFDTAKPLEA